MATFKTIKLGNRIRFGARPLSAAAALLLEGFLMAAGSVPCHASGVSIAEPETTEAGDHMVRRCKPGSKQELCYWARVGSHHDAER